MRRHPKTARPKNMPPLPNFILVDEALYQRFAEFCRLFNYQSCPHCRRSSEPDKNTPILEMPDDFNDFILIDNQTGRVIR